MANRTQAIETAQRKVDAIDKRIDMVRAEMFRKACVDMDAFDYETPGSNMAACIAAGNARRDVPGYDGMERALFIRRSYATDIRDDLIAKEAKAAERRERNRLRKQWDAERHSCPTCGHEHFAEAA